MRIFVFTEKQKIAITWFGFLVALQLGWFLWRSRKLQTEPQERTKMNRELERQKVLAASKIFLIVAILCTALAFIIGKLPRS
jgi:hypothetical protein